MTTVPRNRTTPAAIRNRVNTHGSENSLSRRERHRGDRAGRGAAASDQDRHLDRGCEQGFGDRRPRGTRRQRGGHSSGDRRQPAPDQPASQPLAASRLPALDGPDRPAESTGGLLMGQALQVAEHHGLAEGLRQAADLLVDRDVPIVGDSARIALGSCRHLGALALVDAPLHGQGPGMRRDPQGHGMEPRTERIPHPQQSRLVDQDEEDRLEGILGVVLVAQGRAADAQHHRTVTLDQGREGQLGRIIPTRPVREPLQELTVRQLGGHALAEDRTDVPQDTAVLLDRHGMDLRTALPRDPCNAAKPPDGSHILSRSEIPGQELSSADQSSATNLLAATRTHAPNYCCLGTWVSRSLRRGSCWMGASRHLGEPRPAPGSSIEEVQLMIGLRSRRTFLARGIQGAGLIGPGNMARLVLCRQRGAGRRRTGRQGGRLPPAPPGERWKLVRRTGTRHHGARRDGDVAIRTDHARRSGRHQGADLSREVHRPERRAVGGTPLGLHDFGRAHGLPRGQSRRALRSHHQRKPGVPQDDPDRRRRRQRPGRPGLWRAGLRRRQQSPGPFEHRVLHRGPSRLRPASRRSGASEGADLRVAMPEPQERVQRPAAGRQGQRRRLRL